MKNAIVLTLAFVFVLIVNTIQAEQIQSIVPTDAKKLIDSQQAVFVDVREVDELLTGTIQNSINIPMSLMDNNDPTFKEKIGKLPLDKTVIVFCRSGRRSGIVGEALKKKGYKVLNLGGYDTWKKSIAN